MAIEVWIVVSSGREELEILGRWQKGDFRVGHMFYVFIWIVVMQLCLHHNPSSCTFRICVLFSSFNKKSVKSSRWNQDISLLMREVDNLKGVSPNYEKFSLQYWSSCKGDWQDPEGWSECHTA